MLSKTDLEIYLKKAVKKVFKEKKKVNEELNKTKKHAGKFYITEFDSSPQMHNFNNHDNNDLNQEERERVIEIMLSQDKVIQLLYDRPTPDQEAAMR